MDSSKKLTLGDIGSFLKKLAEKSESVYWLSSPDFTKIQYISPAYEKIWGRSCEILYKEPERWITYLHPDDVKDYHPIHAMAERVDKLGSAARYEENYRIIRPDGEIRWIIDRGFPIYDNEGHCAGVTGVAVDITAEKQAEEALREAKKAAEAANQLKTEFMHNMEHDIRTPCAGILGFADYLRHEETDPVKKQRLGYIVQSAEELLDYCNTILDFEKIELGSLVLEKKFYLKQILQKVIQLERPAAEQKHLSLILQHDAHIPRVLVGDSYRLHRILLNLVGNAIKFTEAGSVTLVTELLKNSEKQAILRFRIRDTGMGIPKAQQEAIFERFTRLSLSNKGLYKGLGLGLQIVKRFMQELEGEIDLRSELGKGTEFICTIPFRLPLTEDFVEEEAE